LKPALGNSSREPISGEKKKKVNTAEHQWLMGEILATQEAEIRKISSRSQPGGQIVLKILS
jgi:hypothetical protein